ncbi:MAG: hypothetical protein ACRETP_11915 [Steroidobacteraceae bacterium]
MAVETWYARRVSRELLRWYRQVRGEQPQLAGKALYQQVIMRRSKLELSAAIRIVWTAEQSFSVWPTDHDLRFRDVVMYVAIDEYLRSHEGYPGTQTTMAKVVARVIPDDL